MTRSSRAASTISSRFARCCPTCTRHPWLGSFVQRLHRYAPHQALPHTLLRNPHADNWPLTCIHKLHCPVQDTLLSSYLLPSHVAHFTTHFTTSFQRSYLPFASPFFGMLPDFPGFSRIGANTSHPITLRLLPPNNVLNQRLPPALPLDGVPNKSTAEYILVACLAHTSIAHLFSASRLPSNRNSTSDTGMLLPLLAWEAAGELHSSYRRRTVPYTGCLSPFLCWSGRLQTTDKDPSACWIRTRMRNTKANPGRVTTLPNGN
jgi:hypothetical protein